MEDNREQVELSTTAQTRNFSLASFTRAKSQMIATNDAAYQGVWDSPLSHRVKRVKEYSISEIDGIIESGSLSEQQKLSRNYFYKDGYYKQIIIHYATLLMYMGLLIPNPSSGKNLSTSHIQKRYYSAMDFVENMQLQSVLANCAQRALVDGAYYGVRAETDKKGFSLIDLPSGYACSRFKDTKGNDIVEFDVSYFNTIFDKDSRKAALAAYPKIIGKAYHDWDKGKRKSKWVILPSDIGVCFPFFDGRPLFLSVIPATIQYDEAIAAEREKEAEEIRKIIVQKIPHLSDGRLLFEPEEAQEIHDGTVQMMKGNKNVSVLTTYGDVDAIISKTSADNSDTVLNKIEHNIYAQAGVSGQIFTATGSVGLEASLVNDLALMMYLANKFSTYLSNLITDLFGNGNISFSYKILPITWHNQNDYIDSSFKLASSGYSFLLPALAAGFSQRDLSNVKDLENTLLKLGDKLIPLTSSYTQSGSSEKKEEDGVEKSDEAQTEKAGEGKPQLPQDEGGRPKIKETKKAEQTIKNEESIDRTGGGS